MSWSQNLFFIQRRHVLFLVYRSLIDCSAGVENLEWKIFKCDEIAVKRNYSSGFIISAIAGILFKIVEKHLDVQG